MGPFIVNPLEHKHAAIRYLTNRMNTYRLNSANKGKEKSVIKHILHYNKYDVSVLSKPTRTGNVKNQPGLNGPNSRIGKGTKFITKLFRDSSINITFTTQNTISKLLSTKPHPNRGKFENSGIYQLTCPDCKMKYIGQTGGHSE